MTDKPGPTGDFPDGKLSPEDEGALKIAISAVGGKVIINFGCPVRWVGLNPAEAKDLAAAINECCSKAKAQRN